MATEPAPTVTAGGLFARNATGLVRGVSQRSSLIINLIPGHPAQTLAANLFFALAFNPGGNIFVSIILVAPMTLAFAYAFGLLTQMIPRSGGDYLLVSRVIHPGVGLLSCFCMTMAGLLSNAFFGLAMSIIALGPGLLAIGLISGNDTLVSWSTTLSTSHNWQFAIGCLTFLGAGAIQIMGWRVLLRVQAIFFWMVTGCLGASALIALFTSNSSFVSNFNSFAGKYTHQSDTYHGIINAAVKAGVNVSPGFSWSNTIPLIGVFATTAIFSYWSTFVGGELRQASTIKTSNMMALGGLIPLVSVMILIPIFFHSFGEQFMRAANANGLPSQIAVSNTPFFFLASASVGNTVLAVILVACFAVFWPLITYISSLQQTRMLFAWAFDGILPAGVTRVNSRGCPWVALVIALGLSAAVMAWAIYSAGSNLFLVLGYATLIQLIAMMLVGLAAMLAPSRRPELYRASASQKTIAGVPAMVVAGFGAIVSGVIVWAMYLHYPYLIVTAHKASLAKWTIGTLIVAALYYAGARAYKQSKGVDLDLVYREIPPE